ncbi:ASST-domain-containing protein [Lasiosphaeria hispida]|uniref:ASST-domain-containing protein n=1 Tax=Lasiosphaeria hispida TaxID=260671 RepID=A0AAJ0MER1_9PEZI|nr:ASST-domain-containing protein [Lasiosphaeria hispida]
MRYFCAALSLLVLHPPFALADWQYRSRPDLTPPRLNITIPATDEVGPGFIFVTPYPSFEGPRAGPEQSAAYIFRDNGDLVWSSLGYLAGWIGNLQAVRYKGRPVLQAFQGTLDPYHGHGFGTAVLLDQSYQQIATVQSLSRLVSIHEFRIVDERTAIFEIFQPTPLDLQPYGGSKNKQWIIDGIWQEIDIETGELIFEGHSLDFSDPSNSAIPPDPSRAGSGSTSTDAWDYFHVNSIDKDSEGNYLISGRHTSTIYKLSGRDGSLIWQLGGRASTFAIPDAIKFGYQHDARFLSRSADGAIETISFFDNAARSDRQRGGGLDQINPQSSARIFRLNHTDNTATEVQRFLGPDGGLVAPSQGNAQVLPNGNVFVNWGQAGAVTEFRGRDATPVFHAYLDSGALAPGVQSYRGFRYEWEGRPREGPAVVALRAGGETTVYVSWNGDTVAATWEFYARVDVVEGGFEDAVFRTQELGAVARTSFETSLAVASEEIRGLGDSARIFAVALDAAGQVIGKSSEVAIQDDIRAAVGRQPGRSKEGPSKAGTAGQSVLKDSRASTKDL